MAKGFSFDEFKSKKKNSKKPKDNYPKWLDKSKQTIVSLIDAVHNEEGRVRALIDKSSDPLPIKSRQIKNINVCNIVGVTKSYLRKDRKDTANVLIYIEEKNKILEELSQKKNSIKTTSGRKLLRSELEIQNKKLKNDLKKSQNENDITYFQQWVDSFLVDDRKKLVSKIDDLKEMIDTLDDEKASLKIYLNRCRRNKYKTVK